MKGRKSMDSTRNLKIKEYMNLFLYILELKLLVILDIYVEKQKRVIFITLSPQVSRTIVIQLLL